MISPFAKQSRERCKQIRPTELSKRSLSHSPRIPPFPNSMHFGRASITSLGSNPRSTIAVRIHACVTRGPIKISRAAHTVMSHASVQTENRAKDSLTFPSSHDSLHSPLTGIWRRNTNTAPTISINWVRLPMSLTVRITARFFRSPWRSTARNTTTNTSPIPATLLSERRGMGSRLSSVAKKLHGLLSYLTTIFLPIFDSFSNSFSLSASSLGPTSQKIPIHFCDRSCRSC